LWKCGGGMIPPKLISAGANYLDVWICVEVCGCYMTEYMHPVVP
jgi:hypothetical protein